MAIKSRDFTAKVSNFPKFLRFRYIHCFGRTLIRNLRLQGAKVLNYLPYTQFPGKPKNKHKPSKVDIHSNSPLLRSHIDTVESKLAAARRFPHGDQVTERTVRLCWAESEDLHTQSSPPLPHIFMVLSPPQLAKRLPVGFHESDHTLSSCESNCCKSFNDMLR